MADVPANYQGGSDLWGYDYVDGPQLSAKWSPFGSSAHEYVWQEDAACGGVDLEESFMSESSDPEFEGVGRRDIRSALVAVNLPRYQEFKANYCDGCPVLEQCLENSQVSDKFWSVRGGEMPGILREQMGDSKKIYIPPFDMTEYKEWTCSVHGRKNLKYKTRVRKSGEEYRAPFCGVCSENSRARSKRDR